MDKNQLARHLLEMNIDKNGNINKLTGALAKEIHELFQQSGIIINNPADLEKLINSIDELDLLGKDKNALRNLGNTYKEQYPPVLKESIEKKNAKVKTETEAREILNQKRGPEKSSETWVFEEELKKLKNIRNHEEIPDEKLQRLLSNLVINNHNISDEDKQEYLERLTILNDRKNFQKS